MKLYTNLVPVLKGETLPCIQDGVILEDKLEYVDTGSVFKVQFINQDWVYLKHKGCTYVYSPEMINRFFKETEVEV